MAKRTEYRNQIVRVADLTVMSDLIEGAYFENVEIVGPAVLVLLDATALINCSFDAPGPDALFWPLDDGRDMVTGAVGLLNSEFQSCRFRRIGIAAPRNRIAELRQGFGVDS